MHFFTFCLHRTITLPKRLPSILPLITCLMALCLFTTIAPITGITAEPLRVVYGFDREFPPFSYEEAGGEPTGFEVELAKAIFSAPNIVLSLRPLAWENVQLELSSGAINVASGMVHTEQRSRLFLFSKEPSFELEIRLFTKIYNRFPNIALARGQAISVEQGTYQHRLLENFKGVNIKPFQKKSEALKALYNDEVVAFCGPVQNTYYYINKLNYGSITTVCTPLGVTNTRFSTGKGRGDILRVIDARLAEIKASGEYDRLYRKWFVRELQNNEITLLHQSAHKASISAYAPYTQKQQGAAVLTTTGKIYTACTLENVQKEYSASALQIAFGKAVAEGEFEFQAAIITNVEGTIQEFSPKDLQVTYEFGRGILCITVDEKKVISTLMVSQKLKNPTEKKINNIQTE